MIHNDRQVLRALAKRWMEIANQPVMAERKRLWTALKDLRAERPMILFETWTLEDYVSPSELECEDSWCRGIEMHMRRTLRQAEEIGDDFVIEPLWRVGWHVHGTGYGVEIPSHGATDLEGGSIGYQFEHPIKTPRDVDRLKQQTWCVDREETHRTVDRLNDAFGGILPVVLHGTEALCPALTWDIFRLIGNDRLLTWVYDEPETIHRLMAFLRDDRIRHYDWLEREGLLGLNNHFTFVGSGSPGYVTELPRAGYAGRARLQDLWAGVESQETTCVSPAMFARFFLPYMAEVAGKFALVYYGCCEPVHDRWDSIIAAIPHVRAVSISPWCNMPAIAEKLGRKVVFSRKPRPAPMSGPSPDWGKLAEDLDNTVAAAAGCNLEIIFRDVYRIAGDRPRLSGWVRMVREKTEAIHA